MYKYITDPITSNLFSIYSKEGFNIIKNYLEFKKQNNKCLIKKGGGTIITTNSYYIDNYQYILGPSSIAYFKLNIEGNAKKKILLFGDYHRPLDMDLNFPYSIYYDKYILNIIDKCKINSKCIDFYLENYKFKTMIGGVNNLQKKDKQPDTLTYIRNLLKNCSEKKYYSSDTKGCQIQNKYYDNLRVHNIDIRDYDKITQYIINNFNSPNNLLNISKDANNTDKITYEVGRLVIIEILKFIFNIKNDTVISSCREYLKYLKINIKNIIENYLLSKIKIQGFSSTLEIKELITYKLLYQEINKNYNIDNLLDYLDDYMCFLRADIDEECRKYDNNRYIEYTSDELKNIILDTYLESDSPNYLLFIMAYMDIYFWFRFFKNFIIDGKKSERGPLKCRYKSQQENIIIYVGDAHFKHYCEVLQKLFNNSLEFQIKNNSNNKMVKFNESIVNKNYNNFNDILNDFCKQEIEIDLDDDVD